MGRDTIEWVGITLGGWDTTIYYRNNCGPRQGPCVRRGCRKGQANVLGSGVGSGQ